MFQKLFQDIEQYYYENFALGVGTVDEIGEIMECPEKETQLRVMMLSKILMAKREYKQKSTWYSKRTTTTQQTNPSGAAPKQATGEGSTSESAALPNIIQISMGVLNSELVQ